MDYSKICFVIMPFGTKKVGRKKVNFDQIYDDIFLPAVNATKLPEGGNLIARRTDKDFFTGNISLEMFHYIEYSRFALADISGLNANVFYELGVRHRAHQAGTAIFKQLAAPIPFDINQIKAFPYEYEPQENIAKSRELITKVLEESLVQNKIDSPVRQALMIQQAQKSNIETILLEAENAIRALDATAAAAKYKEAIAIEPNDPKLYLKLGLFYKEKEKWEEALEVLTKAANLAANYSDAFREKGIVENQVCRKANWSPDLTIGEKSLRRAIELNPEDYDAYASLGGVLKRQKRLEEAFEMYKRATEISRGNPYPLLNELNIYLSINKASSIENKYKFYLERAKRALCAQVENKQPLDTPWSFFNLSEVCLFLEDKDCFLKYLDEGIFCAAKWQIETHRETLELLQGSKMNLPGLGEGIDKLREAEKYI